MRGRGHGRRVAALVAATVLTTTLLGAAAYADPGTPAPAPGIPGQGDIDRAKAAVRDRQSAADRIQAALDAADSRARALRASAGLAAEAYDTAVAQASAASQAADAARTRAAAALDAQHQAEQRLGEYAAEAYRQGSDMAATLSLLHAGDLHDFAVQKQALANRAAAEAMALTDARRTTAEAASARLRAEQTAAAQLHAEARAQSALAAARSAAAEAQSQAAGIQARQSALLRQLAAAQGVELGLERQRQAGLARLAAQQEAARQEAARRAAAASRAAHTQSPAEPAGHATSAVPATPAPSAQSAVSRMLSYIYAQLGKPYVWGGAGPDVFDCSGLAMRGLEAGGWSFPHPAQWQYLEMHSLTYSQLRPGDLVFWAEDPGDPHTIYHEAIYIGNDRIIQAPRPGGVVEEQSLWINGTPAFYGRP